MQRSHYTSDEPQPVKTKPYVLNVRPRGAPFKNLPKETYAEPTDTGHDLYLGIAAKSRLPIDRLRITKASDSSVVPNEQNVSIEALGLYDQSSVFVKDLGPQIAWRTVFLIEYLGPLLIHPLIFLLRPFIFLNPNAPLAFPSSTKSQRLTLLFITLHFLKRELETLYIHRFSAATMPARNIVKNSAHYWLLAGLNIALFTYSPAEFCPASRDGSMWIRILAVILFVVGEYGNFSAHMTLRNLRSEGTKERRIPTGGVFDLVPVTCPNYFFETLAWLGIWAASRTWATALFAAVAVGQMAVWARKKERRLRREFGGEYRGRRFGMLPGII